MRELLSIRILFLYLTLIVSCVVVVLYVGPAVNLLFMLDDRRPRAPFRLTKIDPSPK
jgi:hypothetical protein